MLKRLAQGIRFALLLALLYLATLWFDLLNPPNTTAATVPVGSDVVMQSAPRFRVAAAGSFVQKPGCPDAEAEQRAGSSPIFVDFGTL